MQKLGRVAHDKRRKKSMPAFLKCKVSPGVFNHERSISIVTSDGQEVLGFFPAQTIDEEKQLLKVEILETRDNQCLIRVPGFPSAAYGFIGITSGIWVLKDTLVL